MQDTLYVSHVDSGEKLSKQVTDLFNKGRYNETARAIGMFSILIDPSHTIMDQQRSYRSVLELLKGRLSVSQGKVYASWLTHFPSLLTKLASSPEVVTNEAAKTVIGSRLSAHGDFRSLDDFFFWALDDRKLTLAEIVRYVERTVALYRQ